MKNSHHFAAYLSLSSIALAFVFTMWITQPKEEPRSWNVTVVAIMPSATATRTPVPSCPVAVGGVCWEATQVPKPSEVPFWPGSGPANPGQMYRIPLTPYPTIAPEVLTATAVAAEAEYQMGTR